MWAVIGALVANGLITVFKGIGFDVTGSASMGAEALPKVHMSFLETARESQSELQEPLAQHMG